MLSEMTTRDLAEWEAYFSLEPWGCEVEDHRAGVLAHYIAAPHMAKGHKPPAPAEIFPSRVAYFTPKPALPLDDEQVDRVFSRLKVIDVPPPGASA